MLRLNLHCIILMWILRIESLRLFNRTDNLIVLLALGYNVIELCVHAYQSTTANYGPSIPVVNHLMI